MDEYLGKRLNERYEIAELIGIGGMANVYRALDLLENRVVAVKILREEFLDNEEFVRRFKNESKAISVLSHPNIVNVFDVSFKNRHQFIVMELVDGITLKEYITMQGEVNWKEVVHFTTEILRALDHAHSKGVIHRDVKPQNIMLLPDGNIKVMDFGIARFARIETGITTNKAMGSVHYISPEQAKGDHTGATTDIYSVGIMMFEMLTGQLPFEADTPISVAIKQISDNPRRPRELNPTIPEGLEEIVIRAMQKDPLRRYPSAAAMLQDLDLFKRNPSMTFEYQYMTAESTAPFHEALEKRAISSQHGERRYVPEPETQYARAGASTRRGSTATKGRKGRRAVKQEDDYYDEYDDYEEEEEREKSALVPILTGVGITFAVLALTMIIFFFVKNNPFKATSDITVPNLVGKVLEDAQKEFSEDESLAEITFKVIEIVAAPGKKEGEIIAQNPEEGRMMKFNGTIEVKIAGEDGELQANKMPNLVSLAVDEAKAKLDELGVKYVVEDKDSTIEKGKVLDTLPKYNAKIDKDTEVKIYVSTGKEDIVEKKLPDVVGSEFASVQAKLQEVGATIGTKKEVNSDRPEGEVVSQDPAKDTVVTEGMKVNLEVSNGKGKSISYEMKIYLPNMDDNVYVKVVVDEKTVLNELLNPSRKNLVNAEFDVLDGTIVNVLIDDAPLKSYAMTVKNGKVNFDVVYDNTSNFEGTTGGGVFEDDDDDDGYY